MKCRFCGYEGGEDFTLCPCCGNAVTDASQELCIERERPVGNAAANRILSILKDKLFLVICILVTLGTAGGIFSSNFNIIHILATVFLWLLYSQVSKNKLDSTHLRNLSGTIYANYVIINVCCVICAVCGVLFGVFMTQIGEVITDGLGEITDNMTAELAVSISGLVLAIIIAVVFIVIAVLGFLFNFFGLRSIHRFVKSVYQSVDCGEIKLVKCKAAHNWLMVLGVFQAIGAVACLADLDIWGFIAAGGIAVAQILAAILINRSFSDCE